MDSRAETLTFRRFPVRYSFSMDIEGTRSHILKGHNHLVIDFGLDDGAQKT